MHLTKEEEHIYDGERGWANQTCMKILVRLGELFNAEKLIPIDSAHVSGVSYKTLGDAPLEFLRALADEGGKTRVRTTLNPQSLDPEYLAKRIPAELCERQSDILRQFERMGTAQSLTCTPYYLMKPRRGSHLAWAESSAVVYANSVLGAWTNREGGPSALAAAIIGKTPNCGMHRTENRRPDILVKVETPLRNETEYGALGICLGKILGDRIPTIRGLRNPAKDRLKQLGAALGTTGMTHMFHYAQPPHEGMERMSIEKRDITGTIEDLSEITTPSPDLIFLGCPHCSLSEIKEIARIIGSKRIKNNIELWICTSAHVKKNAKEQVKKIEKSGGHVLAGVCTIVSWTEKLGIRTIMTNSAKTAYYAPTLSRAKTTLAPREECLKTALKG